MRKIALLAATLLATTMYHTASAAKAAPAPQRGATDARTPASAAILAGDLTNAQIMNSRTVTTSLRYSF